MKILITGGTGMLGNALMRFASQKHEVVGTYLKDLVEFGDYDLRELNITDRKKTIELVKGIAPETVIHTAAFTNVDACETEKETAYNVNVLGVQNVAFACKEAKCRMIYISTDYVFDGEKGNYVETDKPNPVNYYAETKLLGEQMVKGSLPEKQFAIARINLYGWNVLPKNDLVTWIIDKNKKKEEITAFTDWINSPFLADNCAEALVEMAKKGLLGIYHLVGDEAINRHDFALRVAEIFDLDPKFIKPGTSAELNLPAKRPKDISLRIDKAKKDLDTKLLNVGEGLKKMKEIEAGLE